jgi:predicted CXXCH cytochrome family protein
MLRVLFILAWVSGTVPAGAAADNKDTSSGYVGSDQCGPCHSEIYDAWKTSAHSRSGAVLPSDGTAGGSENCTGCHTTGMTDPKSTWSEKSVGCEACHGPGQGHVEGGGDTGKIVSGNMADICGRCHIGDPSGKGLMQDGTGWVVGYRPGMQLSEVPGLRIFVPDPDALPPAPVGKHPLIYNTWKASGHSRVSGRTFQIDGKEWSGPITCVACHNPHQSDHAPQLVTTPDKLCSSCHSQDAVVKGKGAKGIEDTRSLHTAISCVECHMTEKNHLMRILRPDDPNLAENRTDTCSSCHEVKDRKIRAKQIQDWEEWYREALEPVQAEMQKVEAALESKPDSLNAELNEKLERTRYNLAIIEKDGSHGVHNLDYALEILSLAKRDLAKIKAALE